MGELNIVFYGDSNTYGYTPNGGRYENRFTTLVEDTLNKKYHISEEGVVGRTSIYPDRRDGRVGISNINEVLGKYESIDYLVIMLGTNDFKKVNARSSHEYRLGMEKILDRIVEINNFKKLVLVSPILLAENIEDLDNEFDHTSYVLSKSASKVIKSLSKKYDAVFFDAKTVASAGSDGEHFTQESHFEFAKALANIINNRTEAMA